MKTKTFVTFASIWLVVVTLAYSVIASPVSGAQSNYVDATKDFWITVPEGGSLHLWTDLCDDTTSGWCGGIVDSMLWLYDSEGNLLAANDDSWTEHVGGHSLASNILITVNPGEYRVRAGVCCGDPAADRFYGNHYYLISNFDAEVAPGTPSATWTPTPEPTPTPTPEPTPTPTPSPYLNVPAGLLVTVYENGDVNLTWEAPLDSGTPVERYAISWRVGDLGWGVSSVETSIMLPWQVFASTGGPGAEYAFTIRADNDTLAVYSSESASVSVVISGPVPPTPTPTPEPTPEPTPSPTPEPPTPSPTVAPTPTPEPSVSPSPVPTPTPTPEVTNEPTPDPTATPEPSPEPTPTPTESVAPSPDPSPVPTDTPGPIDPGAAVEAVSEAIGEAAAAVGEAVGAAVETVANLGNDITEEEREEARTVVGPAVIMTTIAQAAASAAAARSSGGGWSGGGGDGPKKRPGGGRGKGPARRLAARAAAKNVGKPSPAKAQDSKPIKGGQRRNLK